MDVKTHKKRTMTAIQEMIEIIKQKRKESEISNTLLRFAQIEAEKLLEKEKKQQDDFAIGFAKWVTGLDLSKKLLEIYKKTL
jgi:hypothetical protein